MGVLFSFNPDGEIELTIGHNLTEGYLQSDDFIYYLDVINGMKLAVEHGMDDFANRGFLLRSLYDALHEADEQDGIIFEPDDEILDAVADAKIIQLKDRMN